MTKHPELRKGRCCLFIPIKDNAGKELSAASISCWICTTIVDSHATIQNNKNIPGKVHAVATSLQLFNKVDLQAVKCIPGKVHAVATSLQLFNKVDLQACDEGREMVQWRDLHVLLSSRPLPTS